MDEVKAGTLVQWYEILQEQMIDFLKYVPAEGQNMNTWSPRLSTIIMESCGIIDSLLRYVSPPTVTIHGRPKKRDKLELCDYEELYSSKLKLPERKVIVLTSPPAYRTPFGVWSKAIKKKAFVAPDWWTTHNHLKHKRIDSFIEATMAMAIDALAGSLLIIASLPQLIPALMRKGWLNTGGTNPEYIIEKLQAGGVEELIVETDLFAVCLGDRPLPNNIRDFRPLRYGGSARLSYFFGKW